LHGHQIHGAKVQALAERNFQILLMEHDKGEGTAASC
jgi:hypothetical protein